MLRRLKKELEETNSAPIPGVSAGPVGDDLTLWNASIVGPEGTPYEGGVFSIEIQFSSGYPYQPPRCKFLTRIYHCNIARSGSICLDILKKQWSPVLTISKVLLSILALLSDPNPSDPLSPDVARMYRTNRPLHDATAREWTNRFASC